MPIQGGFQLFVTGGLHRQRASDKDLHCRDVVRSVSQHICYDDSTSAMEVSHGHHAEMALKTHMDSHLPMSTKAHSRHCSRLCTHRRSQQLRDDSTVFDFNTSIVVDHKLLPLGRYHCAPIPRASPLSQVLPCLPPPFPPGSPHSTCLAG